jgi:hypothetical protein
VTVVFGALLGNGERPQFLPTRVRPQDFNSRADRERTINSSARCVSPPLYPSGTCKQAPVLRPLSFSQHFELLLPHHTPHLSPAPRNALQALRFPASPSQQLQHPCCLLLLKQFPSELETKVEVMLTASHYSSNASMTRLTTGSLAWVDESTCDRDHAWVRLSSNLCPISSTGLLVITRSFIRIYSIRADFLVIPSSCAVSGSVTIPWQPTMTPCL